MITGNSTCDCGPNGVGTRDAFRIRSYYKKERWYWFDREIPCDASVRNLKINHMAKKHKN